MAHLPRAVHLVAEAPELHAVGICRAVFFAQVAPVRAAGVVAVFHQIPGGVRAAGAEVHRHHGRGVNGSAPAHELVGAEGVGLGGAPCELQPAGAVLYGADAVFPVVTRNEVAAGVPHERDLQFSDQGVHVGAEAVSVRRGVARLVDAAVNGSPEMLDERAVNTFVDVAYGIFAAYGEFCVFHRNLRFQ